MLSRSTRIRLTIFAVLGILVLTLTAVSYVRLPQLLGFGQFTVRADFADATGLYTNANVTYRGASIGKVTGLKVERTGVIVSMSIDDGTAVPADSVASVHSTSAIGEQYVDFVPESGAAATPTLHDGSMVARADTRDLPSTSAVIDSLDQLVRSLPAGAFSRTLTDLATAFDDAGPDLQRLLTSAGDLVDSAQQNFPQTRQLLRSLSPFLATQSDLADQTTSTVSDLTAFTHQLVLSNGDIVGLIRQTPALAKQVTGVEDDLTPNLNILLENLTSNGQVLQIYQPAVKQILTIFPALVAGLIDFAQGDAPSGRIPLYFHLNLNDPPRCIKGFLPVAERRDPSVTTNINTPSGLYCKQAPDSIESVRGARNLPCLNNPGHRAATPAACLGLPEPTASSPMGYGIYRTSDGSAVGTNGQRYQVKTAEPDPKDGDDAWQQLLLGPIGK